LIVGDIVNLECAGVDVAQDQVGFGGGPNGSNARELPIQADRADEGGASELIVVDVVELQCARAAVAQQEIAFAGDAAEVADGPGACQRALKGARIRTSAFRIRSAGVGPAATAGGWTIRKIVLCAQRGDLRRLDKLSGHPTVSSVPKWLTFCLQWLLFQ